MKLMMLLVLFFYESVTHVGPMSMCHPIRDYWSRERLQSDELLFSTRQIATKVNKKTRLHSSRMRTARALTVSLHLRGYSPFFGGSPFLGGSQFLEGVLHSWGVFHSGGSASSMHWGRPPLWTEFLTHAYENITLPQTSFAGSENNDIILLIICQ